jgi:hypothetical protein
MDYATLIADADVEGSIKYWINYKRIDSAGILDEAQSWIFSKIRIREMHREGDLAIAQGVSEVTAPAGFLDPIQLAIPGYINDMPLLDTHRFRESLALDTAGVLQASMPTAYSILGQKLQFNSRADMAYTGRFVYYGSPDRLSPSNTTNFLTDRYPTLLRRACLMFAAEARKEYDAMDRAEIKAMAQVEEVKKEGDLHMRGMELDFNWREAR